MRWSSRAATVAQAYQSRRETFRPRFMVHRAYNWRNLQRWWGGGMVSLVGGRSPRVQLLVQGQQGVTFSCNEKWHETKVGWILNGIVEQVL